jgi:tetratricopeptide (TPR) repeat protein
MWGCRTRSASLFAWRGDRQCWLPGSRFKDIVDLTERIANEDDASALLLVFRGVALREQGYKDAAHEAFKEALKSRSRSATIRHYALFERATSFENQGKQAMARKDLERILAEDSTYPDVQERLNTAW